MRILWTVNTLMPSVANKLGYGRGHAISWVDAMSSRLKQRENITLAMATTANVKKVEKHDIDNITYYILPSDCDKVDYWPQILEEFNPDVIHAYGTEKAHNLFLFRDHKEYPIIGSLQGILTEYQHHFYGGLDFSTMLRYTTLQDFFTETGFFSGRNAFIKKALRQEKNPVSVKKS